jgi:hypothetical protein
MASLAAELSAKAAAGKASAIANAPAVISELRDLELDVVDFVVTPGLSVLCA